MRRIAAYSHRSFTWTICRSVGQCVGVSSALWKNGGSDPDVVWHHRSNGSIDEARSGVWDRSTGRREGIFLEANLGRAIVTNGDLLSQRRGPLPKLLWADLLDIVKNYQILQISAKS